MKMPPCPNSTNSETLYLSETTYPGDSTKSYYIEAKDINRVLQEGKLPLIRLNETCAGPKIAIILAQEKHPDRTEKDYSIHPYYVDAVIGAGGCPVFFGYDQTKQQLDVIKPDGILLIGGCFVSPGTWYTEPTGEKADKRGKAYLEAIEYAHRHRLPTLGICAGMQMLAGTAGAKMFSKIENHKKGGENIAHKVHILSGSLLHGIIKQETIETNSAHSEAVNPEQPGKCLITARSEDGIVEAVELKEPWSKFVLGVQWHPEFFCKKGDLPSLSIFKSFVEAAQSDK